MLSICFQLLNQSLPESLLIQEPMGPEMRRVLQGMLKFDVEKRSSAEETMMMIKGKLYVLLLVQFSKSVTFSTL